MKEHVIVIGAGGHAKVVISTLLASDIKIDKIFDDNPEKWGSNIFDIEVTGPLSSIDCNSSTVALTAIGDNKTRRDVVRRFEQSPLDNRGPSNRICPSNSSFRKRNSGFCESSNPAGYIGW